MPFLVKPDSCKLRFSGSFTNWLLVNFCKREALAGDCWEEGSESQVLPSPFLSPPSTHLCLLWLLTRLVHLVPIWSSALGVWEHSLSSPLASVGRKKQLAIAAHLCVDSSAHVAFQLLQQLPIIPT